MPVILPVFVEACDNVCSSVDTCSSEPSWASGLVTLARAQYNFGEVGMLSSLDLFYLIIPLLPSAHSSIQQLSKRHRLQLACVHAA